MKLHLNATSPFARLVRVVALEQGITPELIWTDPWANPDSLLAVNPLGRVPVLVTEDGTAIVETLLIVQHLRPQTTPQVLSDLGTAYGVMDLAFTLTIHRKHCGDAGAPLQHRRNHALLRALDHHERRLSGPWTVAHLCLWIALDYIRFRNVVNWPPSHFPALNAFNTQEGRRLALRETSFD